MYVINFLFPNLYIRAKINRAMKIFENGAIHLIYKFVSSINSLPPSHRNMEKMKRLKEIQKNFVLVSI